MTNDAWLKCILAQAFENKTMCKIKKNSFLICVLLNNNTLWNSVSLCGEIPPNYLFNILSTIICYSIR